MKPISLGISERLQLIGVFNQVKGDIETLQAVLEDVKEVSLSKEEKEDINFREVRDEKTGELQSFAWDKTPQKEIKLSEKTVDFFKKFMEDKSKAKELGVADAPLLEVNRKINDVQ